jgi:7-keto-8-aminopelargonate synthetase-like enzyme
LPACQASVAIAALEVMEQKPELVEQVWANVDRYLAGLKKIGFDTGSSSTPRGTLRLQSGPGLRPFSRTWQALTPMARIKNKATHKNGRIFFIN